jgi:GTP-binding protein EngB required for normal cell division
MPTSNSKTESAQLLQGASGLLRLAEIASQSGTRRTAHEARSIADRVTEGLFYVACVGQFKRGKSTLLDALVGERILPTGVIPVTTVPTVIRFGVQRRARARLQTGAWSEIAVNAIEQYVSEEHNPQNQKAVAGVEVFVPAPLLATGMCLVDTPGLGSVFAANTETTREFIPHIDAAIAVFGADPPLSGDELELLAEVASHVADFVFVLNKSDRTTDAERSAAEEFSRRMLEGRLRRAVGPIYQVSALEQVENRGPGRDWPRLVKALEELATRSGPRLTLATAQRGSRRLCDQLLTIMEEEKQALLRPLEESERRIAALRQTIAAAERSLADLAHLFTAEEQRLSQRFAKRRDAFLDSVRPVARQELAAGLRGQPRGSGPSFRRAALRTAQQIAQRQILPWLESEQVQAADAFRSTAQRFIELANDFLRRMAGAGLRGLASIPETVCLEEGFRTESRFYFYDFITIARPASPLRYLADVVLGIVRVYDTIGAEAFQFLELLLETNASRVQNDLEERVLESRRRLEAEIRALLREITTVAEHALEHARTTQAAGRAAVQAALERLGGVEREVRELRKAT